MIYTSYFASKAPIDQKIVISLSYPRFLKAGHIWSRNLAPETLRQENWQELYWHVLCRRYPNGRGLAELFAGMEKRLGKDPILCCYEKRPQDCHRSILAKYAGEKCGIDVVEWNGNDR